MCLSGASKVDEIDHRRKFTTGKIQQLQEKLSQAKEICGEKACVYSTGSYGRQEAGTDSDLDLFIVGLPVSTKDNRHDSFSSRQDCRELTRLDEICLKAELISATKHLSLPEFDGDGEYLRHYTGEELVKHLGKPDDDMRNTFTARLLLLLESKPLLGANVYKSVIESVVVAYWRDYEDHKDDFAPTYFVNDVLRLWRTFCINYEARTETEPDEKKIKRRIKNYKLKHSRMLTCFSVLLSLLAEYRQKKTVNPKDLVDLVYKTPTERLESIIDCAELAESHDQVRTLLDAYDAFLKESSVDSEKLIELFSDDGKHKEYMVKAREFGDKMYESLNAVGGNSRLLRQLTV